MAKENFYSGRLTGMARRLYDSCVDNIERGVLEGRVKGVNPLSEKEANDVIKAVLYGNPEYFYLNQNVEAYTCGGETWIKFFYKYDDIAQKRKELDAEISKIASRVRICGSTYDRLCRISAYLGERIRGCEGIEPRFGDAYGALVLKEARCEGYAKAAKLIMDRAGIKSEVVIGDARHKGKMTKHAWNIAYMYDKPFGFDFTWNDKGDTGDFPGVDYLFLSDAEMSIEHFPEYKFPACTDGSHTFWARNNGVVRTRADINNIKLGHIGKNFLAAIKFDSAETARMLQSEALNAVIRLASRSSVGYRSVQYYFNDRLNILSVYPVV